MKIYLSSPLWRTIQYDMEQLRINLKWVDERPAVRIFNQPWVIIHRGYVRKIQSN